jgi:hypothetical protein
MWRSLVSICDGRCCHHLRNVAQFGVCWGASFRRHMRDTHSEPCELGLRLAMPLNTRKLRLLHFCWETQTSKTPGRRLPVTRDRDLAERHSRRLKGRGLTPTIGRRLPRRCLHMTAPHWSTERQHCNVIVL